METKAGLPSGDVIPAMAAESMSSASIHVRLLCGRFTDSLRPHIWRPASPSLNFALPMHCTRRSCDLSDVKLARNRGAKSSMWSSVCHQWTPSRLTAVCMAPTKAYWSNAKPSKLRASCSHDEGGRGVQGVGSARNRTASNAQGDDDSARAAAAPSRWAPTAYTTPFYAVLSFPRPAGQT